jgi:hypothetical protein
MDILELQVGSICGRRRSCRERDDYLIASSAKKLNYINSDRVNGKQLPTAELCEQIQEKQSTIPGEELLT